MNVKIVTFNDIVYFPQAIQCESVVVESFAEINSVTADYILIMERGWDFSKIDSLQLLLQECIQNSYAFGFYTDVKINGIYKNNLPFSVETIMIEEIISPLLLKRNLPIDFSNFNSVLEITRAVGQKFILYRSPHILFNLLDQDR